MGKLIVVRYSVIFLFAPLLFIRSQFYLIIAVKLLVAVLLFYFMPGLFLVRHFLCRCHLVSSIFLAVTTGICFNIVYVYFLSFFGIAFNTFILLLPGILSAVLIDFYRVRLPTISYRELYMVLAGIIFFSLTYTIVPGEDANGHLLLVNMVTDKMMLPSTYTLYPEIHVSYHMGFHTIVAELEYITGIHNFFPVVGSFFVIVLILTSYLCVSTLHTEKSGLISGVLIGFGAIPPLHYLSCGSYSNIMLFAIVPVIIFLVYTSSDNSDIPVMALILAAGFMIHSSFLLFWIPLLTLLRGHKVMRWSLVMSLVLSIPHIMRFQPLYASQEIDQLTTLWYIPETFRADMIPTRIGFFIFVCGVLGFSFLKKKEFIFFSVWLLSLLTLALVSVFGVRIPFQYVFIPNRLVDFMVLPLTFLASIFVSEAGKGKYSLLLILFIMPMIPRFCSTPRSCQGILFETDSQDFAADQEGIAWLCENTDSSSIVLNDWWTGTGSSWITSLGNRRLIFPYLYVHDHFLDILDIPERSLEVLQISSAPDTDESKKLLREWEVDYIFLSSYAEDRVKWRRNAWNVNQMIVSPNYELVFNKNDTYIFKVKEEWICTQVHVIGEITSEFKALTPILVPVDGNIQSGNLIRIMYNDTCRGMVRFWSNHGLLAEIPLLNIGSETSVILPFESCFIFESPHGFRITNIQILSYLPGALGAISVLESAEDVTNEVHIYIQV
ncbi:MAG: hypothetical protein HXS54_05510 [Theionarchaea archaeon]|nr:hypothetical protein [Theionarchaea archaeon]